MKFGRHVENLIASLRGLPEDRGRSILREPKAAESLMTELVQRHNLDGTTPENTIQENWSDLVGGANAAYSQLMRIDERRRAIIGVTSPIVRQELFFHRKSVLARIRMLPGCHDISAVILRAG